ncbi:MAG: hypothetical protein ACP5DZ_09970 [Bacteroidales bacterium]
MKQFIKKHKFALWFILSGLIAGWAYYYFVGCLTGTCPLQKLWYYDMALGGLGGMIIGDVIDTQLKKRKTKTDNNEKISNKD